MKITQKVYHPSDKRSFGEYSIRFSRCIDIQKDIFFGFSKPFEFKSFVPNSIYVILVLNSHFCHTFLFKLLHHQIDCCDILSMISIHEPIRVSR